MPDTTDSLITTTISPRAWSPDTIELAPIDAVPAALIMQTSTVAGSIEGDAVAVRVPYVDDDKATFVPEGATIPDAKPTLSEALVYTGKVAQLIRLSYEQFHQPNTAQLLSQSVTRAVTIAANTAYIAQPKPATGKVTPPAGILNYTGIIDGGTITGTLDGLIDLQAAIAANNGTPTQVILSPTAWASLRKFKLGDAYAASLLGAGTTDTVPMLLGIPVLISPAVPAGKGIMLDRTAIVSAVGQVRVAQSDHAYFSADAYALRCTWRFGAIPVHANRIATFTVADPEPVGPGK